MIGDGKLARMGTSEYAAWWMVAWPRGFVAVTTRTARHITILRHDRHDTVGNGMPFPSESGPPEKKASAGGHLHQRDEDAHEFSVKQRPVVPR